MEYKIVVLGATGVGKSTITVMFVTGKFVDKYDPTIGMLSVVVSNGNYLAEDSYRTLVGIDGQQHVLEILDTATMNRGGDFIGLYAVVIMYSILARSTLDDVVQFKDKVDIVKADKEFPVVLVGNKCDLDDARNVSTDEGKQLAAHWGYGFFETSAKENRNVQEMFLYVLRKSIKYRMNKPRQQTKRPM